MKTMKTSRLWRSIAVMTLAVALIVSSFAMISSAEGNPGTGYVSPAVSVYQGNLNSVVGISSYVDSWDRTTGNTSETLYSQGSGVVIMDGGYVLTNNHVVADCTSFKVLMPSGEYQDAELVGADSSTDLAVLKVADYSTLTPVKIGASGTLEVGEAVIAIGNPGGAVLANSVTMGVVSALERTVSARNATREIKYIQHDAAINSGSSGGALFDASGALVGINTLKYSGSVYSSVSFEGLGFAIPIDSAYPIAQDLIEYGQVMRPSMGVTVANWSGPAEAMSNYPPQSVMLYAVNEGSPAEKAGLQAYDFVIDIDGVKVSDTSDLIGELDTHEAGDTVKVTVLRYNNIQSIINNYSSYYGSTGPFGNYSGRSNNSGSGYETLQIEVTLEYPQTKN